MTIPYKLFGRLTDALARYRINPCQQTAVALDVESALCDWPWNANGEQLAEWQAICDRTRAEFDSKVRTLKAPPTAAPDNEPMRGQSQSTAVSGLGMATSCP